MFELTAILLCGGKGERLKPFTDVMPKPLVLLNGKPLLYHLMRYLSVAGISRFVVCVGYKAESIEQFVKDYSEPSCDIYCVNSGDVSITDRILDAREHVSGKALICYGDTLANVDIASLQKQHQISRALVTLTTYPLRSIFGIVNFDALKRISSFVEKPVLPYWINIGFILCEPEAFNFIKRGSNMPEYLMALSETKRLFAYQHSGKHMTVNTAKDLAKAEIDIPEFFHIGEDK